MASYKRPDVYISEFLNPSDSPSEAGDATFAFVGSHFRGPVNEVVFVRSWTHFVTLYGGFPAVGSTSSELPFAVYNFFSSGGGGCYVLRIAGTGAAQASVMLDDRTGGTALATLQIQAANEGAWGNDIRVSIVDRDAPTGRFDLIVYKGGTTDAFIVERWLDVTMVPTDARYVETVVNSLTSGSAFIIANDQGAASGSSSTETPAAQTGTALTGGADGAAVGTTEYTAALNVGSPFDQIEEAVTINLPGVTTASVINQALTYAETMSTYFVVIDTPAGLDPAGAASYAATLTASSYGAVYYPHLIVTDPAANAPGATRTCPPGAFVLGKIAATDSSRGVWKAPAGLNTTISGVLGLERRFSNLDLDALNVAHVNAIRQVPGAGVVIMGARTLKKSQDDRYVNVRRTLNYLKDSLGSLTEFAIFENNDPALWSRLQATVGRFLATIHAAGGLKGNQPAEAFYVKCDGELNTEAVISAGEVRIEIGVALQRPAEFVVIRLGQWSGGTTTATEA